ncbi:MAG: ATP-binding protein [Bacteroidia bacterium]|nr:ATP-binding protein [Bacteroidia bacterium]
MRPRHRFFLGSVGCWLFLFGFFPVLIAQEGLEVGLDNRIEKAYSLKSNHPDSVIVLALEILEEAQSHHLEKQIADSWYLLGLANQYLGELDSALIYHNKALLLRERIDDKIGQGRSLNNIGLIAQHAGSDSLALSFFQKSLYVRRLAKDTIGMIYSAASIAEQMHRHGKVHSALRTMAIAQGWANLIAQPTASAFLNIRMGIMDQSTGKWQEASQRFQKAYRHNARVNDLRGMASSQLLYAWAIFREDSTNVQLAIEEAHKATGLAASLSYTELIQDGNKKLSELYQASGDFEKAYYYLALHQADLNRVRADEGRIRALKLISNRTNRKLTDQTIQARAGESAWKTTALVIAGILTMVFLFGLIIYLRYKIIKQLHTDLEAQQTKLDFAHRQLMQKTTELELTNMELKAFTHSVSHDLREPVRTISLFLEKLKRSIYEQLDTHSRSDIEFMKSGMENLISMIRDLETYGGLGEQEGSLQPVELNKVLRRVIHDLSKTIEETGATVHVDDMPTIWGQHTLLVQVFLNLIGNGIKFQQAGVPAVVSVKHRLVGEDIEISIQDNGIGIPEEYHKHIFGAFHRLHGKEKYPGSGLGLAIVSRSVQLLHGEIRLESMPEQGSRFILSFRSAQGTERPEPNPLVYSGSNPFYV